MDWPGAWNGSSLRMKAGSRSFTFAVRARRMDGSFESHLALSHSMGRSPEARPASAQVAVRLAQIDFIPTR